MSAVATALGIDPKTMRIWRDRLAAQGVVVLTATDVTNEERADLNREADQLIGKGSISLAEIGRQLRLLYARQDLQPASGEIHDLLDQIDHLDLDP